MASARVGFFLESKSPYGPFDGIQTVRVNRVQSCGGSQFPRSSRVVSRVGSLGALTVGKGEVIRKIAGACVVVSSLVIGQGINPS